ncbi:hypothetical protein CHARACLAT_032390 [Characodon lateralis]|uniref:Uncharacterized protein n=1 Tax=Characodon lateralis TaxID=208331 RepID=A0ABU7DLP5_9TELE|nr:hypothetical protein [Characodon lateralis]
MERVLGKQDGCWYGESVIGRGEVMVCQVPLYYWRTLSFGRIGNEAMKCPCVLQYKHCLDAILRWRSLGESRVRPICMGSDSGEGKSGAGRGAAGELRGACGLTAMLSKRDLLLSLSLLSIRVANAITRSKS